MCQVILTTSYRQFLKKPKLLFFTDIIKDKQICQMEFGKTKINRLYIGNEFCLNLFPEENILQNCLDKANDEDLLVTIVLPYIREDSVGKVEKIISLLHNWQLKRSKSLEVLINDWGLLYFLKKNYPEFQLLWGRLINKKLKDPKLKWKWGKELFKDKLAENSINTEYFWSLLQRWDVKRFEFDAFNKRPHGFEGQLSFHWPYYQTNTSLYCPLNAECKTYNPTKQKTVASCPQYCNDFIYLYPDHLKLFGKGNSVFGFNDEIFAANKIYKQLILNGYDRLVFNF